MSKAFQGFLFCSALAVPFLGSSTAHAATFVNFEGGCLTDLYGVTANRNPIGVFPCHGTFAQKWKWARFKILGLGTHDWLGTGSAGKCVEVAGDATADGTPVQLVQCNGTGAQQWNYNNGHIINVRSGKCLDDDGVSVIQARIRTCNGSDTLSTLFDRSIAAMCRALSRGREKTRVMAAACNPRSSAMPVNKIKR